MNWYLKLAIQIKIFLLRGDEVDYKQRAFDAGAYVVTVSAAKYIHPRPETVEKTVLGVKVPFLWNLRGKNIMRSEISHICINYVDGIRGFCLN